MADKTVLGRFVWHELMTPDTAGAQAFYTKAVGWKTQAWEQDPSYTMFVAPSGPLGGMSQSTEDAYWLTYVRTDDIEATVEKARGLGAGVITEINEMPNGGKYAVLTDPQGARFGVYSSPAEPEPESAPKRGEYSWHELATTDYQAAFDFYSELFAWEAAGEHDMGEPVGTYFMFGRNGTAIGGMFNRTSEMPGGPAWAGYVRVKDVRQTVKKVKSAGGTLIAGPMEVPGGDWIAQFIDPQGAVFSVHTLAADLRSAAATSAEAQPVAAVAQKPAAVEPTPSKAAASRAKPKKAARPKAKASPAKNAKQAAKTSAQKSSKKSAKKSTKKAAKKAAKKKTFKAKSKPAKKRGAAARGAKRPARKAAKAKKSTKKRSGGKKKAAKRARKAK